MFYMDHSKTNQKVDTEKAWQQVRHRLQTEGLLPREARQTGLFLMQGRFRRIQYAATLLFLLALGAMGYYLSGLNAPGVLTLQTGAGDNTFIRTFDDGTVVYLAGNTTLTYPEEFRGNQRKISFSGEAYFEIQPDSEMPFLIETENAVIKVLGTAFNLKSSPGNFEVIVEEGLVMVTLRENPKESGIAGKGEMLTGRDKSIEKSRFTDPAYLSWRMNRMQFRDEKLGNIAAVISRNFNIKIEFDNPGLTEHRLTATFHNSELNTIAEVIAFSFDLGYEILPGSNIIFREKR
jgi:ferric-dicitrate binding protein FerR (iron transport regulator)